MPRTLLLECHPTMGEPMLPASAGTDSTNGLLDRGSRPARLIGTGYAAVAMVARCG